MQLSSRWMYTSLIVAASVIVTCAIDVAPDKSVPTLVEVWSGGDDGLTLKLRDALESAFKSSQDFRLSSGKKSGTLVVTIPSNVEWKKVGRRTRVLYTIEFSSIDNRDFGRSRGHCWDDDFAKCAAQIIKNAKVAARKVQ